MRRPRLNPRISVTAMFVVSMFVRMLDMTIVTVAMPAISRELHVDAVSAGVVVVSYLFGLVIAIPAASWLGDRFGAKPVFVAGLAGFTVASALCAVAANLPELVVFRLLQGLAGGVFGPVVMAMLMRTFPPEERINVSRVMTIPIAAAPLVGSVLGGLITDTLTWRWIFYLNLPIGVVATAFAWVFLPGGGERLRKRFDALGFVLAAGGLTLLMYALHQSLTDGWGSPLVLLTGIGGLLAVALLVIVELRTTHPLLDLRVFQHRIFSVSVGVILTITAYNAAYNFVFPLMYQNSFGHTALRVGVDIAPAALGAIIGAQVAVRMYHRLGPRRHLMVSLGASVLGLAAMALITVGTPNWVVWLMMLWTGAAGAIAYNAAQTTSFATLTPAQSGVASSLFSTATQFGAAVGVSLLSSSLAGLGATTAAAPYRWGFLICAGVAFAGFAVALMIRDTDAANTVKKKAAAGNVAAPE